MCSGTNIGGGGGTRSDIPAPASPSWGKSKPNPDLIKLGFPRQTQGEGERVPLNLVFVVMPRSKRLLHRLLTTW